MTVVSLTEKIWRPVGIVGLHGGERSSVAGFDHLNQFGGGFIRSDLIGKKRSGPRRRAAVDIQIQGGDVRIAVARWQLEVVSQHVAHAKEIQDGPKYGQI